MNSTTITTTSTQKFNQILSLLSTLHPKLSTLISPTTNSITFFTNSTLQTNTLLTQITNLLHLTPLQPSYALAA